MSEISVIVPVYQAERFLNRCVDSILAQTYTDFELVLVDDGSLDDSPRICDAYAASDPRVHVIHQPNSGPSVARNRGIDWAFAESGSTFLTFVDSDDCIHPCFLEYMLASMEKHNAEISMCRHRYIGTGDNPEYGVVSGTPEGIVISAEDLMVSESAGFNYVWAKVYAKECFRELRYPVDVSFGEDNLVIFRAMFGARRIVFLEDQLYDYFYTPTGITKSPWSPRSLDVFEGIRVQLEFYKENDYWKAVEKETELYIQQYAYQIHRIREDREHLQKNRPHLRRMLREMKQLLRENPGYRLRENMYWYEAVHPCLAEMLHLMGRVKRNLKKTDLAENFAKS